MSSFNDIRLPTFFSSSGRILYSKGNPNGLSGCITSCWRPWERKIVNRAQIPDTVTAFEQFFMAVYMKFYRSLCKWTQLYSLTSPYGHLYHKSVYNTDISLQRTVRLVPEMSKIILYISFLYNTDTSVKRTLGSVLLVSVLKRFDCN